MDCSGHPKRDQRSYSLIAHNIKRAIAALFSIMFTVYIIYSIKLDAAVEHLLTVRVAIYVVFIRPLHSAIQHIESNPNTLFLHRGTTYNENT